ncbi:hypothetical protein [Vibrio sp. ER1A]|uniref:hypothetical protein n=1 Tax=Vibrio sp. ER1A TaxID=1517681 RepID=UPI0004DD0799|nr:hypothetical protein [Vibrio sp. ER1A]KFA99439.1 hypothetical protein HW45_03495 [Vibrio sp. ER1A]
MTTTIQIATDDISIGRDIEINGNRHRVEAFSFSPAITELTEKERLLDVMTNELMDLKIIDKDQHGVLIWRHSGIKLVSENEDDEDA